MLQVNASPFTARLSTLGIPALLALTQPLAALPPTSAEATAVFREAHELALKDHGELWGVSLDGPILLVDPQSRAVVANAPDREGHLRRDGNLWYGTLPNEVNVANTATEWAGVRWTMLMWPLGVDHPKERGTLLMHELYHRIQPTLHLVTAGSDCGHLDTRDGRIWLRLEFRALHAALAANGEDRRTALQQPLAFRARRRSLFPQAGKAENALELNEGLAEYTGTRLAQGPADAWMYAEARLEKADRGQAFMRSFCYVSGPALGLLLDEKSSNWRKTVSVDSDLSALLEAAWKLTPLEPLQVDEAAQRYGIKTVTAEETEREARRIAHLQELRRRFKDGPLLFAPMGNISFNPNAQEFVEGLGTFNPTLRLVGQWGILSVTGGCVIASDWSHVRVEAPTQSSTQSLAGPGWTLELKPGWRIVSGPRRGDWTIQPQKSSDQ